VPVVTLFLVVVEAVMVCVVVVEAVVVLIADVPAKKVRVLAVRDAVTVAIQLVQWTELWPREAAIVVHEAFRRANRAR
jgi:hypothetical protein